MICREVVIDLLNRIAKRFGVCRDLAVTFGSARSAGNRLEPPLTQPPSVPSSIAKHHPHLRRIAGRIELNFVHLIVRYRSRFDRPPLDGLLLVR